MNPNLTYRDIFIKNLSDSLQAKQEMLNDSLRLDAFQKATDLVVASYRKGGRLYIAGNGGSAADSQHLAAELVCKLSQPRNSIPAEALTTDTSTLTAIGNDFGYDVVFSRQLEGKVTPNDCFLAITTSGNSKNIIKALEVCKLKQVPSILLSAHQGGAARNLADVALLVPGERTSTIQELHIVVYHSLCESVEKALFDL